MDKEPNKSSGFGMSLLWNFLLNISWSIPAWILLILHFYSGWSLIWFWVALAGWLGIVLISSLGLKFVHKCSTAEKPFRENQNPYSAGEYKPMNDVEANDQKEQN